ncbi:MAG: transketolase [Bacteroidales bacterium]|nr:transketolase [Bacteroidales bacterium]
MKTVSELETIAAQVRRDIIRMVSGAKSGHPGGALGCADFMTALFFEIMETSPESFSATGAGDDMFFLSNGHLSALLYSVMARRGFFPIDELATFRQIGSRLQGHPTPTHGLPGLRIASGSLGQGLSVAIGAALAKKSDNDDKLVFVLTGDGELQEGQNWEALMFAPAKNVDNLIVVVDYNKKQIDGPTDNVLSLGDLNAKMAAFGWQVMEMNGNNMGEVVTTLGKAKTAAHNGKPIMVLMHTEMGMGVDFMMGTHKWHGTPPNAEQTEKALAQLPATLGDY